MEGLRSLMESIDGPRVVAAATSVEDAVRALGELHPSILVVDKAFGAPTVLDWVRLLSTGSHSLLLPESPEEDVGERPVHRF